MRPLFYCYVCVLMLLYSYYICSPYIYLCPHIYIYMRYTYIHIYHIYIYEVYIYVYAALSSVRREFSRASQS
jgi:hypothetical protein